MHLIRGVTFSQKVGVLLPLPFPPLDLPSPLEVGPLVELWGMWEWCKLPQQGPGLPCISTHFQLKDSLLWCLEVGGTVLPTLESGEHTYPSYPPKITPMHLML